MFRSVTKVFFVGLLTAFSFSQAMAVTIKIDSVGKVQKQAGDPIPAKPTDISPLLIGEAIPAVILPDATGKMFNLNEAVAKKPTILIFYRGGWCPFCNKELAGMQSIEAELTKMGYQIIAISTDSPENLANSMGKHQLTYTLLSDSEVSVAKQFGLAYVAPKGYGDLLIKSSAGKNVDKLLPVPAVFILDAKGLIQFEYINPDYQQRMSPTMLTAVAGALKDEMKAKNNEAHSNYNYRVSVAGRPRFGAEAQIRFMQTSWKAVLKKAQAEHKFIFVDAYASWCGPCKELKATTFMDKKVAAFFNAHFVNYSIDTEKGEGVTLANDWGVDSYPTLFLFDNQGKKVAVNIGFVDAGALLQFAQQAQAKVAVAIK